MAQKTIIQLFDDLDGTSAEDITTVPFELDGVAYEIDLTATNAERLRADIADFITAARRTTTRPARGASSRPTPSATTRHKDESKAIRAWAKENGHDISERGRIPASVVEAYQHRGNAIASTPDAPAQEEAKPKVAAFSG